MTQQQRSMEEKKGKGGRRGERIGQKKDADERGKGRERRREEEETGRNSKIPTFPGVRRMAAKILPESPLWVDRAEKTL